VLLFEGYKYTHTGGVNKATIESAESELGFKFSDDFVKYLLNYGTVELNNNELFGLGISGYRNIVGATQKERALSQKFPTNCCVVYSLGIDNILILLGNDGCIYEYSPHCIKKIFDSFSQWILEEFVNY